MNIQTLFDLLGTTSPSGFEKGTIEFVRKEVEGFCRTETDSMGNLYLYQGASNGLKVMITAHADEVGLQITEINDNGFVYFRRIGGLDIQALPGTMIRVVNKYGGIDGVVGKYPPHILSSEDKRLSPSIEDLWIDFGFNSREEALAKVSIGDYMAIRPTAFITNDEKRIISKGLDNKVGLFVLIELLKEIKNLHPSIQIIGVATAQEELGCRGAVVAANKIHPDLAFCIDVGIATDTPNWGKHQYGTFELGKGVGLTRNADNNEILVQILTNIALQHNIPFQHTLGLLPSGGTESKAIQLAYDGIPTANVSIPSRYMHSAVEMCDLRDIEAAVFLLKEGIRSFAHYTKKDFNLFVRNNGDADSR